MQRNEDDISRKILSWIPMVKGPRKSTRKIWLEVMEDDLENWEYVNGENKFRIERHEGILRWRPKKISIFNEYMYNIMNIIVDYCCYIKKY